MKTLVLEVIREDGKKLKIRQDFEATEDRCKEIVQELQRDLLPRTLSAIPNFAPQSVLRDLGGKGTV